VGLTKVRLVAFLVFPISFAAVLQAAPQLRLVSSTVGPVSVAQGAGAGTQTVEAYNIGGGSLNLSLSSSVSWIGASVGASRACTTTTLAKTCIPLNLALNTQALPAGSATGIVTVTDPNSVDAPQTITVTVAVGGSIPSSQTFYVPPNGTATLAIPTNSNLYPKSSAPWLSLQVNGSGSFTFLYPFLIQVVDTSAYPVGTYTGSLTLSGSSFAGDNKTVAVTMDVTTQPIAQATVSQLNLQMAQGAPPLVYPFAPSVGLTNLGQGTLVAQTPAITTTSCGSSWIAYGTYGLTVDPTGLSAGTCNAAITLASNAVNGTQTVPVTLAVVPKGSPVIRYQGVLDNATFVAGDNVAPGDVMVVQGDQLSFSAYTPGPAPPLATQLADTSVLVNGTAAPIFYTSYGQIAFQLPVNTATGQALVQVQRTDGTTSNTVSVNVAARAPKVLQLYGGPWGAIVNNDSCGGISPCVLGGSLPLPASYSQPGYPAYPAKAGDVLTIYCIGMGPTTPSVASGQPAPSTPPFAMLSATPTVSFGGGLIPVAVTPSFAALTPGYAGLYQLNVTVPANSPKGNLTMIIGFPDGTLSNQFSIAVQ
jgi:uncharacterized protein (TIGR03437 family)